MNEYSGTYHRRDCPSELFDEPQIEEIQQLPSAVFRQRRVEHLVHIFGGARLKLVELVVSVLVVSFY